MKIQVKDLESNPYRNLKKYPLSKTKIRGLKTSIEENGFWGGLLVREHPNKNGKYQLAFGHHRLEAVKECGHKSVDNMIVFDLSDDDMLHRMFAENHETWGARPACILENVESARDRLKFIMDNNEWDTLGEITQGLFDGKKGFDTSRGMGVGKGPILKYLGGLYNENQVKDAISILDADSDPDSNLSIDAVKELPTISHVRHFRAATEKYEIPKKIQKRVAKEIVSEGVGRRGVEEIVAKHSLLSPAKKRELIIPKPLPMIDDFVKKLTADIHDVMIRISKLNGNLDNVKSSLTRSSFDRECRELSKVLNELGVSK